MESKVWSFLDFIGENPEDLNLKFDILFAKQNASFMWSIADDEEYMYTDDQWILPGDNSDLFAESSDDEDALEGFESEPFSDSDEDMAAADEEKANSSAQEESNQIMEE